MAHFGILSEGLPVVTSGISVVSPYHAAATWVYGYTYIPEPVITVEASGDLSTVASEIPEARVYLYACAIPVGINGPRNTGEMVSSYILCSDWWNTFKSVGENKSIITSIQSPPSGVDDGAGGNVPPSRSPVSGNASYDIYAAHVIRMLGKDGKYEDVFHGDLQYVSGYRTYAPYPHTAAKDPDIVVSIQDIGEVVSGYPLHLFTFTFSDTLNNFDKLNEFGTGYADPAVSGFVQMTCSGVKSDKYYNSTLTAGEYDQLNDTLENKNRQFLLPSNGSITLRVPKFYSLGADTDKASNYETYDFYIRYINSSGTLSPTIRLTYKDVDLYNIHANTSLVPDDERLQNPDAWHGPIDVVVHPMTHRKRLAVGVQDIDLQSVEYKDTGTYISNMYGSEEPIYAVALDATEQFPQGRNQNPWEFVKYYIQFGSVDTDDWIRVSNKSRVGEVDEDGNSVPNVVILDTQMTEEERESLTEFNTIKFVEYSKPVYTFRVKIEMDTTRSLTRGQWSPFIYDYKALVLNRSILSSANVERYLFT